MGPMRQRLLLVAGWAAAAVVASLVSTGAVAVAGGQVTDQPFSPLSASEVAALIEECETEDRAPCLRQLDNTSVSTTTIAAAPDLDSSLDGDEKEVSPSPDVTTPANAPTGDEDEGLIVGDRDDVPKPGAEVVEMVGARVSVSGANGEIRVIWGIPNPGFALLPSTGTEIDDDAITLVFSNGSHESTLVAEWSDTDGLTVTAYEGGIDLAE